MSDTLQSTHARINALQAKIDQLQAEIGYLRAQMRCIDEALKVLHAYAHQAAQAERAAELPAHG